MSVLPYRPIIENLQNLTLHHTEICRSPVVSTLCYNLLCFIIFLIFTLNLSLYTVVYLGKPDSLKKCYLSFYVFLYFWYVLYCLSENQRECKDPFPLCKPQLAHGVTTSTPPTTNIHKPDSYTFGDFIKSYECYHDSWLVTGTPISRQ